MANLLKINELVDEFLKLDGLEMYTFFLFNIFFYYFKNLLVF